MCLSCSRNENRRLYLFVQLSVMMMFSGQSTWEEWGERGVKRCECERKQRNTKLELERGKKTGVRKRDVQIEMLIEEVRGL